MRVSLTYNYGFKWYFKETISFKGYFFVNDIFYEKDNAIKFLLEYEDLKTILQKLNGVFTILKNDKYSTEIICDSTRSFPIFYTKINNEWYFSDDFELLKNKVKNIKFLEISELEFLSSNHVHGNRTLINKIYQTQSSEYLSFKDNKLEEQFFYFSYTNENESTKNLSELKKNCISAFENSFKRNLKSIKNRQIVIPLSSGFDSRLITVFLKKYNLSNVLCYTYGKTDSYEIEYSKKTAEKLNFKWIFIEYSKENLNDFLNTDIFKEYIDFAGKHISMPNLQEYFAVKYLKNNNLLENNAVFIPGYAGDILGGSEYKFFKEEKLTPKNIPKILFESKMINKSFTKEQKTKIENKIHQNLISFNKNYSNKIPETVFDDYNLKERIAKYIFNSASFYTFFGYEFRFPFWDNELLNFFRVLPIIYKKEKSFFDNILKDYFKEYEVLFEKENKKSLHKRGYKSLKSIIKSFLPTFIKEKRLKDRDWNNYELVTKPMLKEMKKANIKVKRQYKDYNEIITQWYLFKVKNQL